MTRQTYPVETVGEAILELLRVRGIKYLFGGAPTSMLEAIAKKNAQGSETLRGVITPHEQTAVAMAHGYYVASGELQLVYLYSIVGTANALGGIINASRSRIPMILIAARSPISERPGVVGARDIHVQWAQESFDQGALVREYVKWDYELRNADQLEAVIDRAIEVATAAPCGPVYLSVPRELLAERIDSVSADVPSRRVVDAKLHANPERLVEAAELLVAAKKPVIITSEVGRDVAGRDALVALAEAGGFGVLEASPVYANFPPSHPCHLGYVFASQTRPELSEADVVLVVESDVPWFEARVPMPESTRVIQLGVEPFYQRYPMRSFRCDLPLVADAAPALRELARLVAERVDVGVVSRRVAEHRNRRLADRAVLDQAIDEDSRRAGITFTWASKCVAQVLSDDTVLVNEYPLDLRIAATEAPGSYFGPSHAGGLGWAFAAALGVRAARPTSIVVCAVGDGSYHYAVPTSCHYVSADEKLPLLVVVFDNGGWNEVRKSVTRVHPDGWAVKQKRMPLVAFESPTHYQKIVEAFDGYGVTVHHGDELPAALERAMEVVRNEGRQALVHIVCCA
ncbi:MAG: thiamine pyrophosphate-requiring protein [Burkholderiaceae bacterium]|nr:thiamine pyrophosphate-requiring protein [Burkholderiaceae bacterium]